MPETFKRESKYGLTVLTTNDEGLLRYLQNVQTQVTDWLLSGDIQRLGSKPANDKKSLKQIHNEIQAIIRQITASVTFLPLLQEPCTFDLLVYTDKDIAVPEKWADSDPCYILNSAEVKLRSFTTSVHKIDSMVAYKEADEWEI
jgi:mitotic spindle assembly checkpoint protein MAD2